MPKWPLKLFAYFNPRFQHILFDRNCIAKRTKGTRTHSSRNVPPQCTVDPIVYYVVEQQQLDNAGDQDSAHNKMDEDDINIFVDDDHIYSHVPGSHIPTTFGSFNNECAGNEGWEENDMYTTGL